MSKATAPLTRGPDGWVCMWDNCEDGFIWVNLAVARSIQPDERAENTLVVFSSNPDGTPRDYIETHHTPNQILGIKEKQARLR